MHLAHPTPADHPIERAVRRAHHVLPDQGPIGVFVHHNTLHAFQHLPFHEGVAQGARELGARPYLTLEQFSTAWRSRRIADADLYAEIHHELGAASDEEVGLLPRAALWHAWMTGWPEGDDAHGLAFAMDVGRGPEGVDPRLWRACVSRIGRGPQRPSTPAPAPRRHRDALVALGAVDTDIALHSELVRLSAAFLDQGQAQGVMPGRDLGFLIAVATAHAAGSRAPRWARPADEELVAAVREQRAPRDLVVAALEALGVGADEQEDWLFATALALPGWTGMFARLERNPLDLHHPLPVALLDFLGVRLTYERRAVETACREAGLPVDWSALRAKVPTSRASDPRIDGLALHAAARAMGLDEAGVLSLPDAALEQVWAELERFTPVVRQRLWQEAYERTYRRGILDGLAALRRSGLPRAVERPTAQFVFCIDEREESVRRALEEQSPAFETFGAAGFFGVAIDYQGLDDRRPAPYAPVVVTPGHEVHEGPRDEARDDHERRSRLRSAWHRLERAVARRSRGLWGGAGASIVLGPAAGAVATARVLAPRVSLDLRHSAKAALAPHPSTKLASLRTIGADELVSPRGKPLGFSVQEAGERITNTLRAMGLVERFAPVVLILGHGSTSLNNPHESAHDCGACGGRRGGANARLFAELANHPDVRAEVGRRGVAIPGTTWFVGGLHDTANDAVTLSDLDLVPDAARPALDTAVRALETARRESARERCRRFEALPLGTTPERALRHVEERASSLSQPRPEYGHCTNAIAIVGRRTLSRGLFLDRRPFLVSYDPMIDENDTILERILAAVGPVGAGISLEYYFSSVDNEVFGCGTKLPHNVTGLIGVMSGHNGDLRTGLPLQMVEIHEPMRLLLVVEATPESLLAVAGRQAEVRELVVNRWVQLVSVHPETGAMAVLDKEPGIGGKASQFVPYEAGTASLPAVDRSFDWFGAHRAHLPPALTRQALAPDVRP